MGNLTNDILLTCDDENRRGGFRTIYIANRDKITSFTPGAAHEYNAVVMLSPADKWFEIQADEEGISYVGEGSVENGSSLQEVTIEVKIPKLEKVKAQAIQELFTSCKVVAILESNNSDATGSKIAIVRGFDEELLDDAALRVMVTENIEGELQGQIFYTLTLTGKTAEIAREFTGVIELNQGGTKDFS